MDFRKPFVRNLMLVAVVAILAGVLIFALSRKSPVNEQPAQPQLKAPNGTIQLEIVSSREDRARGLSGRDGIAAENGMLFVFETAIEGNCFWMKDMKFPIDMVWLDEQKKVLTVKESIGPETFPKAFCPDGAAKYGLELKAKRASELGIASGTVVEF